MLNLSRQVVCLSLVLLEKETKKNFKQKYTIADGIAKHTKETASGPANFNVCDTLCVCVFSRSERAQCYAVSCSARLILMYQYRAYLVKVSYKFLLQYFNLASERYSLLKLSKYVRL